jgi:anti-anti-sigma factor
VSDLHRVELLGLPIPVHLRASEHFATLRRELAFVHHATSPDAAPARLRRIGEQHDDLYGSLTFRSNEQITQAIDAGVETVDVVIEIPLDLVDACLELGDVLDELDQFCVDGALLTLVTPPEALHYRRWYLGEIVRQLRDGLSPSAWVAQDQSDRLPLTGSDALPTVTVVVEGDLDLGQTSALRDQLVTTTEGQATHVVVDLAACAFMDSTGLSLLVTTQRRARSTGGELSVVEARGQVLRLLERSGLVELLVKARPGS